LIVGLAVVVVFAAAGAKSARAAGPVFGSSAVLNSNAGADTGTDFVPCIATDEVGNWVTVWRSDENLSGAGTDSDIFVAMSSDAGANWTAPAPLASNASTDSGSDDAPVVATDKAGTWIAAWDSTDNLSGAGTDADLLFARSPDNGATWSAVAVLNANANADSGQDTDVKLLALGSGVWLAVWQSSDSLSGTVGVDFDILFSRSTDDGVTWSAPQALNSTATTDTGSDSSPVLASDGSGNLMALWQSADNISGAGNDFDIFFSRSSDGGANWSVAVVLNSNASSDSGNDRSPSLVYDNGGWIAAWESIDKLGNTIGNDSDILFARSSDFGANWTAVAPLNANAATDSGEDRRVILTRAPIGPMVALWESNDDLWASLQGDFDIATSQSFDSGQSWSNPDGLDPGATSDTGDDNNPAMAFDGSTYVAVWDSADDRLGTVGTDRDIFVSPSVGPCASAPLLSCRNPFLSAKGKLDIKDQSPDKKDKLVWKWNRGAATFTAEFGSPLTTTEYTACLYDSSGPAMTQRLILPALIPAAGDCKGKPCWKLLSTKGFRYKDPLRTPNGIVSLVLKSGADAKAKIALKGKGAELDAPPLPLVPPVVMQVSNNAGECWEATYSNALENTAARFKAKDD